MGDVSRRIRANAARTPRVLLFDLERLPGRYTRDIWEPRDLQRLNYLHPDRWDELPSLLCGSWLHLGDKRPGFVAAWESDDASHVARTFRDLMDDADVIVTFNGSKADVPWLRQEWVVNGIPTPTPTKHIDLYRVARSSFAFESKSLRHLCDRLGVDNKTGHYNADEARAAAGGDVKAQRRLKRYSVGDSVILAGVLDRLAPYVKGVNLGLYHDDTVKRCATCGDAELRRDGEQATTAGVYPLWRCRRCGSLSRAARADRAAVLRPAT